MEVINIDAQGRKVGRLATEISMILNGKTSVDYAPNRVPDLKVEVSNASKLDIDVKKMKQKQYFRHTGYLGGGRLQSMGKTIEKKGYSEVLRKAVYGMLPINRLRAEKIKRLNIKE